MDLDGLLLDLLHDRTNCFSFLIVSHFIWHFSSAFETFVFIMNVGSCDPRVLRDNGWRTLSCISSIVLAVGIAGTSCSTCSYVVGVRKCTY
jgi:hypothetical protein